MELKELLAQIDSLKAEIDKVRPLKPEVEHRIMQKFRLDWNYHSNAIEGNSLTLGETRAFLLEGLTANGKPLKDHLDVKGHDDLISILQQYIQRKETLTEADIREMHKILLKEPYEVDAIAPDGRVVKKKVRLGEYKTEPNCVRMKSGEIHNYVSPQDVPAKMAELIEMDRQQEAKGDTHPVLRAALFHYLFVEIHPFDDGNGRMARILMNLILMRAGFPPVVIKLQDREPYIAALRRADAGETQGIVELVAQNLMDSENLYLRGAKGESIEDSDDIDKAIALLKQELAHIDITLTLNPAVQKKCFEQVIFPLLNKVEGKLQQFDDLFNAHFVLVEIKFPTNNAPPKNVVEARSVGERGSATTQLKTLIDSHAALLALNVSIGFRWMRFTKGHLNAFDAACSIVFTFQELQLVISSEGLGSTRVFKRYPHNLSEPEINGIVNGIARYVLKTIQDKTKGKP